MNYVLKPAHNSASVLRHLCLKTIDHFSCTVSGAGNEIVNVMGNGNAAGGLQWLKFFLLRFSADCHSLAFPPSNTKYRYQPSLHEEFIRGKIMKYSKKCVFAIYSMIPLSKARFSEVRLMYPRHWLDLGFGTEIFWLQRLIYGHTEKENHLYPTATEFLVSVCGLLN
jgi:hypothetical protein